MSTTDPRKGHKQLRVSDDTHNRVHNIADMLKGTADDAIRYLLGAATVRVPVTDIQRTRWAREADRAGVGLPEWVAMRVEAAIQYGTDPSTCRQIWQTVNQINAKLPDPGDRP